MSDIVDLSSLGAEIRAYHAAITDHFGSAFQYAIRAGERLHEAKKLVGHGGWLTFLRKECPDISIRTVQGVYALRRSSGGA